MAFMGKITNADTTANSKQMAIPVKTAVQQETITQEKAVDTEEMMSGKKTALPKKTASSMKKPTNPKNPTALASKRGREPDSDRLDIRNPVKKSKGFLHNDNTASKVSDISDDLSVAQPESKVAAAPQTKRTTNQVLRAHIKELSAAYEGLRQDHEQLKKYVLTYADKLKVAWKSTRDKTTDRFKLANDNCFRRHHHTKDLDEEEIGKVFMQDDAFVYRAYNAMMDRHKQNKAKLAAEHEAQKKAGTTEEAADDVEDLIDDMLDDCKDRDLGSHYFSGQLPDAKSVDVAGSGRAVSADTRDDENLDAAVSVGGPGVDTAVIAQSHAEENAAVNDLPDGPFSKGVGAGEAFAGESRDDGALADADPAGEAMSGRSQAFGGLNEDELRGYEMEGDVMEEDGVEIEQREYGKEEDGAEQDGMEVDDDNEVEKGGDDADDEDETEDEL